MEDNSSISPPQGPSLYVNHYMCGTNCQNVSMINRDSSDS